MTSNSDDVTVVLGGRLPTGDANGLADMGTVLAGDEEARRQIRAAIILFDVAEVAEKTDDRSKKVKLRVRRIEAVKGESSLADVQRMLMREFERRTGQTALPFDIEGLALNTPPPWAGKRTWPSGDVPGSAPD